MGEKVKLVSGREGGVGRSGLDLLYMSWIIGEMEKSSVGSKGGGGRGAVVGLVFVWLLVQGLGPGLDSTPARSRRVATSARGREEEKKKGIVGSLWQKRVRVSGRRSETPEKKATVEKERVGVRKGKRGE